MSEHELHAIEASLRRQLAPPCLDALADRIAAAAAAIGEDAADLGLEPALRLVAGDDSALDSAPANATDATTARRRIGLGVLVAVAAAAAAAIVLLLAQPRAPETAPRVATAPTTHQVAGRQLAQFLRSAAYREGPVLDGTNCVPDEPPIAGCTSDLGAPVLPPSPELRVVWECGGSTGIDCAAHDLPAQRMMVVQLMPAGPDVIVCIEPPGADPAPELPAGSGYNIFRRTLGGYVLYEITPLDTPSAVESISI